MDIQNLQDLQDRIQSSPEFNTEEAEMLLGNSNFILAFLKLLRTTPPPPIAVVSKTPPSSPTKRKRTNANDDDSEQSRFLSFLKSSFILFPFPTPSMLKKWWVLLGSKEEYPTSNVQVWNDNFRASFRNNFLVCFP